MTTDASAKDEYLTKDLYEASYFYSKGQELLRLEKEGNTFWFVFKGKEICNRLSSKYWSGKSLEKTFADSVRTLKDLVFRR